MYRNRWQHVYNLEILIIYINIVASGIIIMQPLPEEEEIPEDEVEEEEEEEPAARPLARAPVNLLKFL